MRGPSWFRGRFCRRGARFGCTTARNEAGPRWARVAATVTGVRGPHARATGVSCQPWPHEGIDRQPAPFAVMTACLDPRRVSETSRRSASSGAGRPIPPIRTCPAHPGRICARWISAWPRAMCALAGSARWGPSCRVRAPGCLARSPPGRLAGSARRVPAAVSPDRPRCPIDVSWVRRPRFMG